MNDALRPERRHFATCPRIRSRFIFFIFLFTENIPSRPPAEITGKTKTSDDAPIRVVEASHPEAVLAGPAWRIVVVGRAPYISFICSRRPVASCCL